MLNNVSISKKLGAGLALVLIMVAGVGTYSIYQLHRVNQCTVDLAQNGMPSAHTLARMRGDGRIIRGKLWECLVPTSDATHLDISARIVAIQGDTRSAVAAIKQISGVINQINDISSSIASTVEEQTATTTEMNRNISEANKGSTEIAQNITGVAQAAQSTSAGATQTQSAAGELTRMASDLQKLVGQFRYETEATAGPTKPIAGPVERSIAPAANRAA